jgi:Sulfate permease family
MGMPASGADATKLAKSSAARRTAVRAASRSTDGDGGAFTGAACALAETGARLAHRLRFASVQREAPRQRRTWPLFRSLAGYPRSWLRGDAIAGLTVWAVLVPESLAYASIAGVSPVVELHPTVAEAVEALST